MYSQVESADVSRAQLSSHLAMSYGKPQVLVVESGVSGEIGLRKGLLQLTVLELLEISKAHRL
jgi:hypothetical protein